MTLLCSTWVRNNNDDLPVISTHFLWNTIWLRASVSFSNLLFTVVLWNIFNYSFKLDYTHDFIPSDTQTGLCFQTVSYSVPRLCSTVQFCTWSHDPRCGLSQQGPCWSPPWRSGWWMLCCCSWTPPVNPPSSLATASRWTRTARYVQICHSASASFTLWGFEVSAISLLSSSSYLQMDHCQATFHLSDCCYCAE